MRAAAAATSAGSAAGRWSAFQAGRPTAAISSGGSSPESWTASGSSAVTISAIRSSPASAVIATTSGARPPGARARATRRSSTASSSASSRGVPGTRFSPIASAPARTAARMPSASVMPQIFTNGRAAAFAGSPGSRPAATNARDRGRGSGERTSASPTSAASKPTARQPAIVAASRTPDSATTIRSSGTSARSRTARSVSTSSVRRSRLLIPISRAFVASARSSSRSSWASTSGSSPISRARSTSAARARVAGWRTASSRTTSAPAARRCGSWIGSTTNSFARTGMLTAARTARRSSTEPPNQCGSQRTRDRGRAAGLVGAGAGDDVVVGRGDLRRPTASCA